MIYKYRMLFPKSTEEEISGGDEEGSISVAGGNLGHVFPPSIPSSDKRRETHHTSPVAEVTLRRTQVPAINFNSAWQFW